MSYFFVESASYEDGKNMCYYENELLNDVYPEKPADHYFLANNWNVFIMHLFNFVLTLAATII